MTNCFGCCAYSIQLLSNRGVCRIAACSCCSRDITSAIRGARFVNKAELSDPIMGFNVDGSSAKSITLGAVGAERWNAAASTTIKRSSDN